MEDTNTEQTKPKRGRPCGTTKKTPAERVQSQLESSRRWCFNNHEYRCEQKKQYYQANREQILESKRKKKFRTKPFLPILRIKKQ